MEDIVWFNKESRKGGFRSNIDVTIHKTKTGVTVTIRNNLAAEISETGYVRVGVAKSNRNILYFMAADPRTGWKLSIKPNKSLTIHRLNMTEQRMIDLLSRFDGDYNLEVSEDNLFFIDRRNCLE